MRRLLLLRHAKTEADAPSGRDFDRRLDERGLADAKTIAEWLAKLSHRPQRVLVSTAVRAQQTWDAAAKLLSPPPQVETLETIYDASLSDLLRAIRSHGGDASVLMLVGHNPGLQELSLALTRTGEADTRRTMENNLPTGGLVTLDFDIAGWNDMGLRSGELVGLVTPKLLRDDAPEAAR